MYLILLFRLGCKVSGCHRYSHMTEAQLSAANTGHALFVTLSRNSRGIAPPFCTLNLAKASTTLANTYMTICWLTELWILSLRICSLSSKEPAMALHMGRRFVFPMLSCTVPRYLLIPSCAWRIARLMCSFNSMVFLFRSGTYVYQTYGDAYSGC